MFCETEELFEGIRKSGYTLVIDQDRIIRCTTEFYDIDLSNFMRFCKSRKKLYCHTRQVVIYLLYILLDLSEYKSGKIFGKDHSTASHARKIIRNEIYLSEKYHGTFHLEIEKIIKKIKGER